MKNSKKVSLLILAVLFVCISCMFIANAHSDKTKENMSETEKLIIERTKETLNSNYSERYNISSIDVKVNDKHIENGKLKLFLNATISKTLKVDEVEQIPTFNGMLDKLNINDFTFDSRGDLEEAILSANRGKIKEEQAENATYFLTDTYNEVKDYIGKEDETNFYIKATCEIKNGMPDETTIKLYTENVDEYIPLENAKPESPAKDQLDGEKTIEKVLNGEINCEPKRISYNRIEARDYAKRNSSNPTSCDVHGKSCGIVQDRSRWNTGGYPHSLQSKFIHNDCADFVSQCLRHGGIPTDGTWYPDSYAWNVTYGLKSHMLNMGYWERSDYTWANAGGIIFTDNGGHVVLITKNDLTERRYTAHTNDRCDFPYYGGSDWEYFVVVGRYPN